MARDFSSELKTDEGKPQSPTVITRTFQPFPPEKQHDRKHRSPFFLIASLYGLLKYFTLYHIPAASRAQTQHFPERCERGGHRVWTPSLRGWSWKRPVLLLSASAETLIAQSQLPHLFIKWQLLALEQGCRRHADGSYVQASLQPIKGRFKCCRRTGGGSRRMTLSHLEAKLKQAYLLSLINASAWPACTRCRTLSLRSEQRGSSYTLWVSIRGN